MICIPITAEDPAAALFRIQKACCLADVIELRLDALPLNCIREMVRASTRPVIATYRSAREGGQGSNDPMDSFRFLLEAGSWGADFLDVECSMSAGTREEFLALCRLPHLILSSHFLDYTPSWRQLQRQLHEMAAVGAGAVKLIPWAAKPQDNVRVLRLIPEAARLGMRIIAFCMGPWGKFSRVLSVPLGGWLTFSALEPELASAKGQIPAIRMRRYLRAVGL